MFMFDIETMGIESNSVILSAAITHFQFDDTIPDRDITPAIMLSEYQRYIDASCLVKFNAKEQIEMKRSVVPSTIEWWSKQAEIPRKFAFDISPKDLSAREGIDKIKQYISEKGGIEDQLIWARGTLDQMAIDSLCRYIDVEPIAMYNKWRDVRTALDLIADSTNGYAKIKSFNPDLHVIKHVPSNDCALDILMMLYHV
jgi:3' exoribonuclease, RNase T-like